jgi:hypothetical protein
LPPKSCKKEENKVVASEINKTNNSSLTLERSPTITYGQCNQSITNTSANQFTTMTENCILGYKPHIIKTTMISCKEFEVAGD